MFIKYEHNSALQSQNDSPVDWADIKARMHQCAYLQKKLNCNYFAFKIGIPPFTFYWGKRLL